MDKIESLIDKLEHMITVIPDIVSMIDCLRSHIKSLYYCPPEGVSHRTILIAESLAYYMGEVNNEEWEDWHREVYGIWMAPMDNVSFCDEPTELIADGDVDLSDCEIVLLSQKDSDGNSDDI